KGGLIRPPLHDQIKLEAVDDSGVHANIVLVGEAVEAECHPVKLHSPENQLAFPEVHAAAEQHCKPAIAKAGIRKVRAAEQSVSIGREIALVRRDHRSKRVGMHALAGLIHTAEIASYAYVTRDVHAGGTVPAAGMPATVKAGELISTEHFRLGCFPSHRQH